ncbi:MAG: hypothetical protein ACK4UT_08125 [Moraxellaceae bacterium]
MSTLHCALLPQEALPAGFLELPAAVYAGDPHWLGEDSAAVATQFSAANPWFADGRAMAAVVPGRARLAGFIRDQLIDGERAAFFGFWEGMDDPATHREVFRAVSDWARAQGATALYGPINFSTYGSYRLRLDAFAHGAFPGEPWNPPYYPALLETLGAELRYRYFSTFAPVDAVVASVGPDFARVKPKLEQVLRLEAMTPAFWMAHLDELYGFVDEVFGGNFAYTRLTREEFGRHCGATFAERFCPETSVLARAHDGRIAGFFLVYPDYAPLLRQGNPARLPASAVTYRDHAALLPAPRRALARTGGVHPDFRALGLFTAMGCELSLRAAGRYEDIAGTLVREDNHSRQFALRHGRAPHHYGLYRMRP